MTPIPPWVFGLKRVWVMGYQGIMGYGVDFPLSRLGKAIILWVIRVYGLPEVWVKRVSTVRVTSGVGPGARRSTYSIVTAADS